MSKKNYDKGYGKYKKLSKRARERLSPYAVKCIEEGIPIPPDKSESYEARDHVLRGMGFSSYTEYLNSDLWKRIQDSILGIGTACNVCNERAEEILSLSGRKNTLLGNDKTRLISICHKCSDRIWTIVGRDTKGVLQRLYDAYIDLTTPHLSLRNLVITGDLQPGQDSRHHKREDRHKLVANKVCQGIPFPPEKTDGYQERNRLLREHLGFDSYPHYLASPLWKDIKTRAFREHGRFCSICRHYATVLHHLSYDLDTLKGVRLDRLVPLCDTCHHRIEFDILDGKRTLHGAYCEFIRLIGDGSNTLSEDSRGRPLPTTPITPPLQRVPRMGCRPSIPIQPPAPSPSNPPIQPNPLSYASTPSDLLNAARQGFRPDV